jgi:hypothetical protein
MGHHVKYGSTRAQFRRLVAIFMKPGPGTAHASQVQNVLEHFALF